MISCLDRSEELLVSSRNFSKKSFSRKFIIRTRRTQFRQHLRKIVLSSIFFQSKCSSCQILCSSDNTSEISFTEKPTIFHDFRNLLALDVLLYPQKLVFRTTANTVALTIRTKPFFPKLKSHKVTERFPLPTYNAVFETPDKNMLPKNHKTWISYKVLK